MTCWTHHRWVTSLGICLSVAMPLAALLAGCKERSPDERSPVPERTMVEKHVSPSPPKTERENSFDKLRRHMVDTQLRARGIADARVLAAMQRVPRHRFVPEGLRDRAYVDGPLPIGHDQTISQPYIVALMTELAKPDASDRALDVGTGSGYQAAVLAELVEDVDSIEIVCPLADEARSRLSEMGYENVEVRCGDGYRGWEDSAKFDVIIVAAAPDHIPQPLVEQLAVGGRLVIPVGRYFQELLVLEKQADGSTRQRSVASVAFVPMTGEAEKQGNAD